MTDHFQLQTFVRQFKEVQVDGNTVFALKDDEQSVSICTCESETAAQAIQSALAVAIKASRLPELNSYITTEGYVTPVVLANGTIALAVTVINDVVWKDGEEIDYEEPEFTLGTPEYERFVKGLYPMGVELP